MRDIKFRGKRLDNDEWIYGHYYEYQTSPFIRYEDYSDNASTEIDKEVRLETVGQYTGLKDKNGKEIYDDDLLKDKFGDIYTASWNGCLYGRSKMGHRLRCDIIRKIEEEFEIIGNKHDNPELLNTPSYP